MTKLTILIPAYNEEKTIKKVISAVKSVKLPKGISREILVIDDASKDNTGTILKKIKGIKVFKHSKNRGKGAALATGFKKAKGDILIIQDADLEYNPSYIPKLIAPILKEKTDVVYGTRLKNYPLKLTGAKKTPLATHYIGNKFLSLVTSLLFGTQLTDMETGYKVFKTEILKKISINSSRFDFEPEITAKILKLGYKIHEIPIRTVPRGYDEGKKITWKDGFAAIWALVKYRFVD